MSSGTKSKEEKEMLKREFAILIGVFAVLVGASIALTPESAERVISLYPRGRLVFLSGYMDEVEATTATVAQKWASVGKMCDLLAEKNDLRAVFLQLNATERSLARAVLVEMKTAHFAAAHAAITAVEDEITSGL
jgi:hypothetical protein